MPIIYRKNTNDAYLIDTDVILDFMLARQPFHLEADEIFVTLQNREFDGYILAITPVNVFYIARKIKDKTIAFSLVGKLLSLLRIARCDAAILKYALYLGFSDYEDAVQCSAAMAENLDGIVTRDTKDFNNSPVKVFTPGEFLESLEAEG
jgi:predicted nucleic acid-binding protein